MKRKIYCAYPSTKYSVFASKQDEQNLADFAGEEVAQKFLDLRKKLKSPENDLYYWIKNKSPEELKSFVDNYQSNRDAKSNNKTSGAKLVFNKNGDKIYFITTYDAMKFYGKGTKWCIAGNFDGHESRGQEYFDDYLNDLDSSGYYVVITPDTKVCVLVKNDDISSISSIWNAEDNPISILDFPDYVNQEIMDFFGLSNNNCFHWNGEISLNGNNKVTEVIIEDGLTTIPKSAFANCQRLKSVVIPDSVTSIGYHAFYQCYSLESIEIPNSVTSIGHEAFSWCKSLKSIVIPSSVTRIGENAFYRCESLSDVVIPDSVSIINIGAFYSCSSLQSIEIPNSVTRVGDYAFAGCSSLEDIEIPNSVTSIGNGAFVNCLSLSNIVIPNSVISIGDKAFAGCESLRSIEISDSVTNIGDSAFYQCESLSDVYYLGTKQQFNKIDIGLRNIYLLDAAIHFNR